MRGAKITLLHLPDGSMRLRYKDRDLQYTHVKSSPRPSPAEDEKTIDARLDAVLAARPDNSAKPIRKGVDNGRASYGAVESARRPPVTHPHSTKAPKGTFLICAIRKISLNSASNNLKFPVGPEESGR